MSKLVYIEEEIRDHPRTQEILARLPSATIVSCQHYGEVFNRKAQNFRLQKQRPALILARKHSPFSYPAPTEYAIGGSENEYFSHMLNCPYDCRYCFLQGMYRSANHVLFINYEDFSGALEKKISQRQGSLHFFSGYDCDSLAYDAISGFCDYFLPFFAEQPDDVRLELRTKSARIAPLLAHKPSQQCITAFSFTPAAVADKLEQGVPSITRRLQAMHTLEQAGWQIALRFDPLVKHPDFKQSYTDLCQQIFHSVDGQKLHSVSLGVFRVPEGYYRQMARLYPEEALFAGGLEHQQGMVSYPSNDEDEMIHYCHQLLRQYVPEERIFSCQKLPSQPNETC